MNICLVGKAGVGKDTVADYFVQKDFIKIALADDLKRLAKQIYGFSNDQLWGPSELRNAPDIRFPRPDGSYLTPREGLQKLGTDGVKNAYPSYWIDKVKATIAELMLDEYKMYEPTVGVIPTPEAQLNLHFIISDIRFVDELKAFTDYGAQSVKVIRSSSLADTDVKSKHISEIEQDTIPHTSINFIIDNSGTKENTYDQIDRVLSTLT
jgi:hypothetical protein